MRGLICVLALLLAAGVYAAQEIEGVEQCLEVRAGEAGAELQKPLQKLAFFEGTWKIEQHAEAGAQRGGGPAQGSFDMKAAVGGHALLGLLRVNYEKGGFQGMTVITPSMPEAGTAKGDENKFDVYWSDSSGHTHFSQGARFENDKLVINFEDKMGDKTVKTRTTYTKMGDDKIELVLEADTGKGFEKKSTDTYTRTSDKPEKLQ